MRLSVIGRKQTNVGEEGRDDEENRMRGCLGRLEGKEDEGRGRGGSEEDRWRRDGRGGSRRLEKLVKENWNHKQPHFDHFTKAGQERQVLFPTLTLSRCM